ncbi:MAG: NUDIX domain-containing protein [Crocinitomicaceae bacterium]|nr:NUDIX domain-containing protein [Crocinitomicaceae bacterium]
MFNLRVYGIIINDQQEVLISDEMKFGKAMTKFPGGGLDWGEGSKDALKREILEEIGLDSEIGELFYVNDFFQESAFRKTEQLFSFYYFVSYIDFERISTAKYERPLTEEGEKFRWVPLIEISEELFTFPIDKIVATKLKSLQTK